MPSLPWHPFHPFILVGRLFFSKPHRYLLFIYFTFIITHAFFCGVCQRSLWLPNVPGAGPTVSNPLPPPTLLFTAGICDGTSFISNLYFFSVSIPGTSPNFASLCRAVQGGLGMQVEFDESKRGLRVARLTPGGNAVRSKSPPVFYFIPFTFVYIYLDILLRRYFSNTLAHPKPTQQELSGQVTVKDVIVELNGTAGEGAPCTAPFFFRCYCLNGSKTVKHCFCTHFFFWGEIENPLFYVCTSALLDHV